MIFAITLHHDGDPYFRVVGPLTLDEADAMVRERANPLYDTTDPPDWAPRIVVDTMPADGQILFVRGESLTREQVRPCPCGSGAAFADCHGAT